MRILIAASDCTSRSRLRHPGRVVHRVLLEPTVDRSPIEIFERQPFAQRVDLCLPSSNGLQIASSHVLLKLPKQCVDLNWQPIPPPP
jgi:hypothetical protein